jgi:phosphoribosylanthranilate isomerase
MCLNDCENKVNMLDLSQNVKPYFGLKTVKINLYCELFQKLNMKKVLIQIYEIQTPDEAADMIALGVDHIGSVLLNNEEWKSQSIKDTVDTVHEHGAKSSLIPLFNDQNTVFRAMDYYRPDMVHFCEMLVKPKGMESYGYNPDIMKHLIDLQVNIREKFPQIKIIRSIPIAPPGFAEKDSVFETG